jgi:hypothetical protein
MDQMIQNLVKIIPIEEISIGDDFQNLTVKTNIFDTFTFKELFSKYSVVIHDYKSLDQNLHYLQYSLTR